MSTEYPFESLNDAPLVVDAIYKGGTRKNMSDEVLSKLLPHCQNAGGFRKTLMKGSKDCAYIVIFTTMSEPEWPDFLEVESGVFRYYGDNRSPGHGLYDTKKKGNLTLSYLFKWLNDPSELHLIPPILIFQSETGRDVRFLGLAAPGNKKLGSNQELIAFWRTMKGERFQNYEAYFTILNTGKEQISKDWLRARTENEANCDALAPKAWKKFIAKGRDGIRALKSPRNICWPTKEEQLPDTEEGRRMIATIYERYIGFPQDFEHCAVAIVHLMDPHFIDFKLTRPWRDGGRDAVGEYQVGTGEGCLSIDCALEAKLYGSKNGVGVRQMSRLISRIKFRQFGIFVTTSYICGSAYKEVKEDGHPIVLITGRDIVNILKEHVGTDKLADWLDTLDGEYTANGPEMYD